MKERPKLSAWQMAKARFLADRTSRFAFSIIKVLIIIALIADFLAYEKPLIAQYQGQTYFPLFKDYGVSLGFTQWDSKLIHADWHQLELDYALWPPIRWGPNQIDLRNFRRRSPFAQQKVNNWKDWHYLGTDDRGRDVLSGLIHGTRRALTIGLVSTSIALLIGIFLGALAGYYGDDKWRITRLGIILMVLFLPIAWFYAFQIRGGILQESLMGGGISFAFQMAISLMIFAGILLIPIGIGRIFRKIPWVGNSIPLPLDTIIMRLTETVIILPGMMILLAIYGITGSVSIYVVMVVLGMLGWTGILRFTRAEFLRNRELDYVSAGRSLGFSDLRIIFKHVLPNSLSPVWVAAVFGLAGSIMLESSLSFLFPSENPSWGTLLAEAKQDINAWWLGIFPGFAIFATVTLFNLMGEGLNNALDPKSKI